MANNNLVSKTLSNMNSVEHLLPSIVAEAMFQAQEQSIMRGLVRNYTLSGGQGTTVTVPIYNNATAASVTEGSDLTNDTGMGTTSAVLTVAEVGVMTTVTDLALRSASSNVVADVGRIMGAAIAKKIDQDLIGLFAALNGGTAIGNATTEMSAAQIFEAVAKLRAVGVTGNDLACVVNPLVAYDMKKSLTNSFVGQDMSSDVANEAMRSGYVGTIAGVPVYESSNVPHTSGDSVGGIFHRDALGLAMMQDISIETQRDASMRANELVATAVYGVGELFDTYGYPLSADSTLAP